MRATLMYGAGDVRIETVPDARIKEPTDALVAVERDLGHLEFRRGETHQRPRKHPVDRLG